MPAGTRPQRTDGVQPFEELPCGIGPGCNSLEEALQFGPERLPVDIGRVLPDQGFASGDSRYLLLEGGAL